MTSECTCHTEGCGNEDIPITMNLDAWTDELGTVYPPPTEVVCGPCGKEITDIDPPLVPPDEG